MRGILSAVGAALRALANATKTVAVYCVRTGKWITKVLVAPIAALGSIGGSGASPGVTDTEVWLDAFANKPILNANGMDRVRKLAVGLASGHAPAALFENMPDQVVEWLGAMDRKMLCKVACATDAQLVSQMRGEETMRGVLVYDEEAVAEYRKAQGLDLDPDMQQDIEPKPAMAA